MFEFYRMSANPDTKTNEIKKFQYEESAETILLKEKLEKELDNYEIYKITYIDRYYHCDQIETCDSIILSCAVFNNDDKFIGYMENNVLFLKVDEQVPAVKEVNGATSFEVNIHIRRKL